MRRREIDGCPIAGALQIMGDKWSMLIIREMMYGPKRTMELVNGLFPISSRTLVARLRDMEKDDLVKRTDFGGNPPHIEYELTSRGRLLVPLLDSLRKLGEALHCNECDDRKNHLGVYCEACPRTDEVEYQPSRPAAPERTTRRDDDSIVLL
ncbi:MAG: winged helix-turn-helix transcriptional regulator [Pyrinomonadaceae bacterium]